MAEVTINNSPIHSDSIITALYGETGSSWSGIHTGSDFAPYGSTPANPDLYSVCSGVVVDVIDYDPIIDQALGNQVVIRDNSTNYYWRYCHMATPSPLGIGDNVLGLIYYYLLSPFNLLSLFIKDKSLIEEQKVAIHSFPMVDNDGNLGYNIALNIKF